MVSRSRRQGVASVPLGAGLRGAAALAALLAAVPAWAQNWRVTPSVSLSETLTDNVELESGSNKRGDLVTQLSPGIRIDGSGARVRLNLDYRYNALLYARESDRNNNQNFLRANGFLEAVEDWLFIDASGSISQQNLSAFAPQATDGTSVDRNRTETSSYRLSPYVKGRLGSLADYEARYAWTSTSADSGSIGSSQTHQWNAKLEGNTPLVPLSWSVSGDFTQNDYERGRDTETSRLQGFLVYRFDPQFRISGSVGREANDYLSLERESKTTYGAGFDWAPSERTQVSAFREERFFGKAHRLSLSHRTPRTLWRISDVKDTETLSNQLASAGQGTAFDLLFDALASRFPDPVLRAQATEQLLRVGGIPPDLNVPGGALTTRVFVQRRSEASLALLGVRNTVTLTAHRTERQSLGQGDGSIDDFNLSTDVRQRGFSASWAHNLSSMTSLNLLSQWNESTGTSSDLETSQWTLRLLLSTQFGPKTSGSLGLRHVRFENTGTSTSSFRENAVTATVTHRF